MKKEQKHINEKQFLKSIESIADENSLQRNWESVVDKFKSEKEGPEYIELPEKQPRLINSRMIPLIRMSAIIIILLGISFLLRTVVFNPEQHLVSGSDLENHEPYQLLDGSLVYLQGNSKISFSKKFGAKNRDVTLKGEAFFEVERNEQVPFRIKTNSTITQVLGTSFNVFSDQSEHVRVSVVSGVVEFYIGKRMKLVTLEAGEQGTYDPLLRGIEKELIDDNNFQAWKTGILYFSDTPINEAFKLLQKQYGSVFVFDVKKVEIPTITTTIDNQPLESVLEELNLLLNTNNETRNDTIYLKPNS